MQTKVFDPIVRVVSPVLSQTITNATSAALLGLGLSRRRRRATSPITWLAAGLALGGAAAIFLAPAGSRDRLTRLLQRGGGGVGKRVGQLVGSQVGAHPVATAKIVEEARDVFDPHRA